MRNTQDTLKQVYKAYARDPAFHRLRSHGPTKRVVPGRGSMTPHVIFVGEAPGKSEAKTRKPFMGPAGKVLDQLLVSAGLTRGEVFITNVVKYRPTIGEISIRNRTPSPDEVAASRPYLIKELSIMGNDIPVVLMGKVPMQAMLPGAGNISDHHGRMWYGYDGRQRKSVMRTYVTVYHPAVAVYDPSMIDTLIRDFSIVKDLL